MTGIREKLELDIFTKNKKSLFDVSLDDSDKNNPVNMVDIDRDISKDIVIDFDAVKTDFCGKFSKSNEVFKSADALFYSKIKNKLIFVEFKNGNVKYVREKHVKEKLKDSLLVFSNIVDVDLKFCRKYLEYIVVYNYEKNKPHKEYMEGIAKPLRKLAEEEMFLWHLEIMKDICVSDVHTYTVDEFVKYYSDNCIKGEKSR
jgi:hypothetical protein